VRKLVVLALSSVVAFSPALSIGAQARSAQAPPKPVEISLFASHDPFFQGNNLDTNTFSNYAEKQFNLKFDWTTATPADAPAKQSLLLESGNYPAVFYNATMTPAQMAKYGKQGILVPLNKYLTQYAPNVLKALHEFTGAPQAVTAPDGTIWGIPSLNYCLHCDFAAKLWMNTSWLAKVHMSMPKTPADLLKVLTAFKTIPGVKNPIPLTGSVDGWNSNPTAYLMNAFQYDDGNGTNHLFYQNGTLAFAPVQLAWQQGLTFIHSLVTAGVLDSTAFTQGNVQLKTEVARGQVGAFAWGVDDGGVTYGPVTPRSSDWVIVPPLTGPNGANYASYTGGVGGSVFTITNKASQAQIKAILTFVNWLFTLEGTNSMVYGPSGPKTWYFLAADTKLKGLCAPKALQYIDATDTVDIAYQNYSWNQMGPMYQSKTWRCGGINTPVFFQGSREGKYQFMTSSYMEGHQPKYVYPAAVWFPASQLTTYGTLNTTINQYVTQWTGDFIFGRKDLSSDWDAYVSGLKGLGLDNYMQTLSSAAKPVSTAEFCPTTMASLPCHH
jgi:putative aldouronate transport system substrate-binding protein